VLASCLYFKQLLRSRWSPSEYMAISFGSRSLGFVPVLVVSRSWIWHVIVLHNQFQLNVEIRGSAIYVYTHFMSIADGGEVLMSIIKPSTVNTSRLILSRIATFQWQYMEVRFERLPDFHAACNDQGSSATWILHENLAVAQPLTTFPALYVSRRLITVFTRARHWFLFRRIQSIPQHVYVST
jgi:hypothetical protein